MPFIQGNREGVAVLIHEFPLNYKRDGFNTGFHIVVFTLVVGATVFFVAPSAEHRWKDALIILFGVLYVGFLRGRGSFTSLEKWQTDYLPVYVAWAAMVVILFPPLFRYI